MGWFTSLLVLGNYCDWLSPQVELARVVAGQAEPVAVSLDVSEAQTVAKILRRAGIDVHPFRDIDYFANDMLAFVPKRQHGQALAILRARGLIDA